MVILASLSLREHQTLQKAHRVVSEITSYMLSILVTAGDMQLSPHKLKASSSFLEVKT